jgi:TrmH family RNA methyltransferase
VRLRNGRVRARSGQFIIDGVRELARAIDSEIELLDVFVCRPLCNRPQAEEALQALDANGIETTDVTEQIFSKVAFGDRNEGIVALGKTPSTKIEGIKPSAAPLIAILDGVEKPGNLGAAIRTADAAGVDAVIAAEAATDLYNPNAIRASLGTIFCMQVAETSRHEALQWIRERELAVFAARPDAATNYLDADFRGGCAIVMGSEAAGLPDEWGGPDVQPIRLPMAGVGDSLNVAATAAVLFYEVRRQRVP